MRKRLVGSDSEYIIPFSGLKVGTHEFSFDLDQTFFEQFDQSDIHECSIHVDVTLERKEHMLTFDMTVEGIAKFPCDRCQDEADIELDYNDQLIVKFGEETSDFEEEIIILGPQEHQISLKRFLYEFAHLALPLKKVHKTEKECNQDVIRLLEDMQFDDNEEDNTDPRWDALKGLTDQ